MSYIMSNFKNIENKLEAFINRFYVNELIKGMILFFAIGLLYFIFTLFIESVLWLNTTFRTLLFWLFFLVEFILLVKFIILPLAKLFKLKSGINYTDASKIIGSHFPEVGDKLLNVLQLKDNKTQSELLLASIDQKSIALKPVPFKLAINFKQNLSYLKYAALPVIILLLTFFTGHFNWFSDSYKRVTNYSTAFEAPAPFQFYVLNDSLNAVENKDFKLIVKTLGDVQPDNVKIEYNKESYFLQEKQAGQFEYVFENAKKDVTFQLSSNNVTSKPYTLNVLSVPSLLNFSMHLNYPKHTNLKNQTISGTGNYQVPEGTTISWLLKTKATDKVFFYAKDTLAFKALDSNKFSFTKRFFNNLDYSVSTSNSNIMDYEHLNYFIEVDKDEYPEINVSVKQDSTDLQTLYFKGQVSDDYGFSKLQLVYYPSNQPNSKYYLPINVSKSSISQFISSFPDAINVTAGISYDIYFEVFDNDGVNRFKSSKSKIFNYRKRTAKQEKNKQLNEQNSTIKVLSKSLNNFEEQEEKLQQLTKTQTEKRNLDFNDKKKLESFIKRQKEQDIMMKNFNKKLKENLENFEKENKKEDAFKEDLKQRLKENEAALKKNEKLLKELEKLSKKINKEELGKKLKDLAKSSKSKKRSLQQLIELTKRFYVEKKLEKLKDDLENLSKEQNKLSDKPSDNNTKSEQEKINKKFDDFKKDIESLEKENKSLRKPFDISRDKIDEKEVDKEQKEALENLDYKEKSNTEAQKFDANNKAKKNQKSAAKKMKAISDKMKSSMSGGGGGGGEKEDMAMLRQILDNLVVFSFDQENLMKQFNSIDVDNTNYASYLRKQQNLKEHFEHIDDSLFALSLRQPKLSEEVNTQISEVFFNIDRSNELFAENQLQQGVSKQQFTITSANNLANLLNNVLDNMQENMSMSPGKGKGDQQLPDIIMSQEELNKLAEEGMKKGEEKGEGKEQGKGDKEGESGGKDGEKPGGEKDGKQGEGQGKEGKGKQGEGQGKDGNGNGKGDTGKGKDGKGENGEGQDGDGEGDSELLYQIYQKQQALREALKSRLEKEGLLGQGKNILQKMEGVELDLLNNGITKQSLQRMVDLKHQLLKLEQAAFQQGKDKKRKSDTNNKDFNTPNIKPIDKAKQYFNSTEILNRQALPLRPVYKKKVQSYFKFKDD